MYGAIIGDMVGSPCEFDEVNKRKDIDLFRKEIRFMAEAFYGIPRWMMKECDKHLSDCIINVIKRFYHIAEKL